MSISIEEFVQRVEHHIQTMDDEALRKETHMFCSESGSTLRIQRSLLRILGVHTAIFLASALDKEQLLERSQDKYGKSLLQKDGWFWWTIEDRIFDTGLGYKQQLRCIKQLRKYRLLRIKKQRGEIHRTMFKIHFESLAEFLINTNTRTPDQLYSWMKSMGFEHSVYEMELNGRTLRLAQRYQESYEAIFPKENSSDERGNFPKGKQAIFLKEKSIYNKPSGNEPSTILPKGSIKGPDGPPQFLNDSNGNITHTDGWANISAPSHTKIPLLCSSMTHRIREKTASKSKDASRRTTTKPIPSREEMPKTFQTWYSIAGVSKSKPETYWKNVDLLHKLERGEFPIKYKSLKPAFVERLKLTRQHLCKRWTDEELAELLETRFRPMVEDAGYWPEDKRGFKGMSFEQFVRNPRTGHSWFLEAAHQDSPRLTRTVRDQRTLNDSPYREAIRYLNEEFFNIPTSQIEELAELSRQFAAIMEVMRVVPCREVGGPFHSAPKDNPMPTAHSIGQFLVETYGGMDNPSPGMLAPSSKSVFRWTEQYDWEFPVAGRQKTLRDLFKEYCSSPTKWRQRYAGVSPAKPEDWEEIEARTQGPALANSNKEQIRTESIQVQASEEAPPKPSAAEEMKRREEEALERLSPDDIIYADGEKPKKGEAWRKALREIKRSARRMLRPLQVDESYAGF